MSEVLKVVWDVEEKDIVDYQNKISTRSLDQYIFYDNDGNIKSISNQNNRLDLPYITLSIDELNSIINGKHPIHEYKVVFSPNEKEFVLIHIDEEEDVLQSIHEVIYQYPFKIDTSIPIVLDSTIDITVIQDYTDTCWKFYINNDLAYKLGKRKLYFDNTHELYVTSYNDPNILLKTMRVPLRELITNFHYILPFDDLDYNEIKVSIYSRKLFSKYQYIKTKL